LTGRVSKVPPLHARHERRSSAQTRCAPTGLSRSRPAICSCTQMTR